MLTHRSATGEPSIDFVQTLYQKIQELKKERTEFLKVLCNVERVMTSSPFSPVDASNIPFEEIELWNKTLSDLRITISDLTKTQTEREEHKTTVDTSV